MGDAGRYLRAISRKEQAELTATDLVRSRVALSFKPEGFFLRDVTAGAYFDVEGKFGSPAFSIDELRSSPRDARQAADGVIVRALNIHAQTAVALPQAARCDDVQAGAVVRVRSVIVFVQGATSVTVGVFDNHDGGPRWRSEPTNPVGSDQATRFDLPTLSGAPPWGLHIRGTGGARLCTLPSSAGGDL